MILLNGPATQMLPDVARPAHGRSGPAVLDLPDHRGGMASL